MKQQSIKKQTLIITCIISLLFLNGCSFNSKKTNMEVNFLDVGQGDSILIAQDNHYMLIDAGENDQEEVVVSYLQNKGVEKLDYVIGTHPHSDHIGGLDAVIQTFDVETIILPNKEHTTKSFEDLLNAIEVSGNRITKAKSGNVYTLGEAEFTIISQDVDYGDDINNWSVGIKLTYGKVSFVMCGDAEKKAEADMVEADINLEADVLKVGHHGSNTSTSDSFLSEVDPSYAVICVGAENDYGHPEVEILEKLKNAGVIVYRTDEGNVTADTDGETITWSVEESKNVNLDTEVSKVEINKIISVEEHEFIINTNTEKFHLIDCNQIERIKEVNKEYRLGTYDKIVEEGYKPCNICLKK